MDQERGNEDAGQDERRLDTRRGWFWLSLGLQLAPGS